jgi:hypothetical protein
MRIGKAFLQEIIATQAFRLDSAGEAHGTLFHALVSPNAGIKLALSSSHAQHVHHMP